MNTAKRSHMNKVDSILYHISTIEPQLAAEVPRTMLEDAVELFPRDSTKAIAAKLVDAYRQ